MCANCGIAKSSDERGGVGVVFGDAVVDDPPIKLKSCDGGCDLMKYCSDGCRELHRLGWSMLGNVGNDWLNYVTINYSGQPR